MYSWDNSSSLTHSQIPFGEDAERNYYEVIKKIYEKLGCEVRWLKISELKSLNTPIPPINQKLLQEIIVVIKGTRSLILLFVFKKKWAKI